jgi:hypothetical protein
MVVQLSIQTHIPEDRKIFLELPAETPTGDVDLHLTIDDRQNVEPICIPELPPQRCARSGVVREIAEGPRQ